MTLRILLALPALLASSADLPAQDWSQWRGPTGDNHATAGATLPAEFGPATNAVWRTPVPGRGHSSPTVVGDRVYLTTALTDTGVQALLAFDRATGAALWTAEVHQGGLPASIHPNNTHATPTVAADGERAYVAFHTSDAIFASAYDHDGTQAWQKRITSFRPQRYKYGYGASPRLVGDLLVVAVDQDNRGGGLFALDPATGRAAWSTPREAKLSFSSPQLVPAAVTGSDPLVVLSGLDQVAGYDPKTGKRRWSVPATTMATCGTVVWAGDLVFASGGYPGPGTFAVHADGSGVAWKNSVKCYEQSLLVVGEHLYAVSDNGVAYCWRCADGREAWKARLGGRYSASPVLVGDRIVVAGESGAVSVFAADPERFTLLGRSQLGDSVFATPAVVGDRAFFRYADGAGADRQEYLLCVGG